MTVAGSPLGGAGKGDAHLVAALGALAGRIPPERVDEVWLFAPRSVGEKESGLAVLTVFPRDEERGDRRILFTLRYEAEPEKTTTGRPTGRMLRTDLLEEQGVAPADRLDRIVDGVVRRMGGAGDAPEVRPIGGDAARWEELLRGAG